VFHQIAESNRAAVVGALRLQGIAFHLVAEWVYRLATEKLIKTYTVFKRRATITAVYI
jgi:hypothetical protein